MANLHKPGIFTPKPKLYTDILSSTTLGSPGHSPNFDFNQDYANPQNNIKISSHFPTTKNDSFVDIGILDEDAIKKLSIQDLQGQYIKLAKNYKNCHEQFKTMERDMENIQHEKQELRSALYSLRQEYEQKIAGLSNKFNDNQSPSNNGLNHENPIAKLEQEKYELIQEMNAMKNEYEFKINNLMMEKQKLPGEYTDWHSLVLKLEQEKQQLIDQISFIKSDYEARISVIIEQQDQKTPADTDLKAIISLLEQEKKDLLGQIFRLQQQVKNNLPQNQNQNSQLLAEYTRIQQNLAVLKQESEHLHQENNNLQSHNSFLQQENMALKQEISKIKADYEQRFSSFIQDQSKNQRNSITSSNNKNEGRQEQAKKAVNNPNEILKLQQELDLQIKKSTEKDKEINYWRSQIAVLQSRIKEIETKPILNSSPVINRKQGQMDNNNKIDQSNYEKLLIQIKEYEDMIHKLQQQLILSGKKIELENFDDNLTIEKREKELYIREKEEINAKLEEALIMIRKYESDIDSLKAQLLYSERMVKLTAEYEIKITELLAENKRLKQTIELNEGFAINKTIEGLNLEIKNKSKEIGNLNEKIKTSENKINDLNDQLSLQILNHASYTRQLEQLKLKCDGLSRENYDLKFQLDGHVTEIGNVKNKLHENEKAKSHGISKLEEEKKKIINEYTNKLIEYQMKHILFNIEIERLNNLVSKYVQDITLYMNKCDNLQTQLDQAIFAKVEQIEQQKKRYENIINQLKEQIMQSESRIKELLTDNEKFVDDQMNKNEEIQNLKLNINQLIGDKSANKKVESDINELRMKEKQEKFELELQIKNLYQTLDTKNKEIEKIKEINNVRKRELDELTMKHAKCQNLISQEQYAAAILQIEDTRKSRDLYKSEVESLAKKYNDFISGIQYSI